MFQKLLKGVESDAPIGFGTYEYVPQETLCYTINKQTTLAKRHRIALIEAAAQFHQDVFNARGLTQSL